MSIHRKLAAATMLAGLLVWSVGCGRTQEAAAPSEDASTEPVVATFDGGEVTLAEVESMLPSIPAQERSGDVEQTADLFARLAADRVVEEVLLDELGGQEPIREMLGDEWEVLRRQVLLDRWLTVRAGERPRVTEEEIETFWAEHEAGFSPPPQRFLSYIFRRSEPSLEQAIAELEVARDRVERGEAFAEVAREVSHSETRAAGGRLGWVPAGRLAPNVEAEVFDLRIGSLSRPIPVSGGAAVFHVVGSREGQATELGDVRSTIRDFLTASARLVWLEELSAGLEPPPDAIVYPTSQVVNLLASDPDAVVLEVEGDPLAAEVLADRARQVLEAEVDTLPPLRRLWSQVVSDLYREDLAIRLLALEARAEKLSAEASAAIESEVDRLAGLVVARRELDERMLASLEESELELFFEDNAVHYGTPVQMNVSMLFVPLGEDPDGRFGALELWAEQVRAGRATLAAAVEQFGGRFIEPRWIDFDRLDQMPPKVAIYVQDLAGTGVTVPFRLGPELVLVEVLERREPEPLSYPEVAERVRADYLSRHQQRLYREVVEEILDRVGFELSREAVIELIAAGADLDPTEPPASAD